MADMNINSEKAGPWIKSVQEEVAAVNQTLGKVREVCSTFPGEGDSVFQLIEKTGNMLEETWNHATNVYKNAWEKVEEGLNAVAKAGHEVEGFFEDFFSKNK